MSPRVFVATAAGLLVSLVVAGWSFWWLIGPNLCEPEQLASHCLREWLDPLAAFVTVVAIIYAALQFNESRRQSDAAVRDSLIAIRDGLLAEIKFARSVSESVNWPMPPSSLGTYDIEEAESIVAKLTDEEVDAAIGEVQKLARSAGHSFELNGEHTGPLSLALLNSRERLSKQQIVFARVMSLSHAIGFSVQGRSKRSELVNYIRASVFDHYDQVQLFRNAIERYIEEIRSEMTAASHAIREIDEKNLEHGRKLVEAWRPKSNDATGFGTQVATSPFEKLARARKSRTSSPWRIFRRWRKREPSG